MYPQLYSMIAPNLFQGGTDDLDVIHLAQTNNRPRTDLPFDAIVTMYAWGDKDSSTVNNSTHICFIIPLTSSV